MKLFSRADSPITVAFASPSTVTKFQSGALNKMLCDFRLKSPFISETVKYEIGLVVMER